MLSLSRFGRSFPAVAQGSFREGHFTMGRCIVRQRSPRPGAASRCCRCRTTIVVHSREMSKRCVPLRLYRSEGTLALRRLSPGGTASARLSGILKPYKGEESRRSCDCAAALQRKRAARMHLIESRLEVDSDTMCKRVQVPCCPQMNRT